MPVYSSSEVKNVSRLQALRSRHFVLSRQIEDAQKDLMTNDYQIVDLKKQKLRIKEELSSLEETVGVAAQ